MDLRQLLNLAYAALAEEHGASVDDLLDSAVADDLADPPEPKRAREPEPVKVAARNQEWLASLRAAGVPLPPLRGTTA